MMVTMMMMIVDGGSRQCRSILAFRQNWIWRSTSYDDHFHCDDDQNDYDDIGHNGNYDDIGHNGIYDEYDDDGDGEGDGDDDGDGDGDGDDEKTFISSASTATPIAAIACFGQLIWSKIIVNLSILGVCAIILMINLSTDEVAARSGWVTMSTRLCDSCKVN